MAEGTLQVDALARRRGQAGAGRRDVRRTIAVDPTTGTDPPQGDLPERRRRSSGPGSSSTSTLTLATEPDASWCRPQAVQTGQQGAYVFVVKPDATVGEPAAWWSPAPRAARRVIAKGLEAGESVVTDGQPRLTQGAKIEIRTAGGPGGGGPGGGGRAPGAAGGERPAGAAPAAGAERPAGAGRQPGAEQRPAADTAGGTAKPPAAERPRTP